MPPIEPGSRVHCPRSGVARFPFLLGLILMLAAVWSVRAALPGLQVATRPGGSVELSWPTTPGARLESADAVGTGIAWVHAPESASEIGGRTVVVVGPSANARFFRLRGDAGGLTTVSGTSPAAGETGVAVTRETVFRLSGPLAPDSVVDADRFRAIAAGRRLLSRVEMARDRETLTLFYLEYLPAGTRVTVELEGDNLRDAAGRVLDADGDGEPGGIGRLEFTTAGTSPLPGTAVVGWVFASERAPDGSDLPLEGVTITVDGAEETLRTVTDARGYFELAPSPAGRFFVHVDGRTAVGSQWPGGNYYPFVGKAWEAVAGVTNNRAGGTGEIYLPLVPSDALQVVSATAETRIGLPASVLATNPALASVAIRVPPDALFGDSGVRGGRVGLASVAPDRLPEPLPPGLAFPLVISIQTDGPMNFDRPVPVRFPNLPDPITGKLLPAGARTALWSFNHDTGRWEAQGGMTVTPDGAMVETDPGVGVRQPGWHGTFPGSPGDGPNDDDDDGDGDGDGDGPNCPNGAPPACCQPGGWDELKKQCENEKELALNATLDLGVDGMDFLLEALPGGCLASAMFETGKTARDCVVVGQFTDQCADIASDNGIGFGLSCIPVVGGVLDLGWGGKQLIDNLVSFDGCLDNIKAVCGWGPGGAQLQSSRGSLTAVAVTQDPRVEKIKAALALQIELSEASSNLLARFYGSSSWSKAGSPADLGPYQGFLSDLSLALSIGGPGGRTATTEERAQLLNRPLPSGVTVAEAAALVDRLEAFAGGSLRNDATTRNQLVAALDRYLDRMQAALNRGWRDPFGGFREAMELLTSMYQPGLAARSRGGGEAPSGPALATVPSTNSGTNAGPVFPEGRHYFLLRDHDSGFVRRGRLNGQNRLEPLILGASTSYSIAYFDPLEMQAGVAFFTSAPAGTPTRIPTALMLPLSGPESASNRLDQDADGLSDLAETIVGTSPSKVDTDGDGRRDVLEVMEGTDPLDGLGLPNGVIGVAAGPGRTWNLAVQGSLAVLAGDRGLGVYDVSDPRNPVQVSLVPGSARSVVLRDASAVAVFADGRRSIDLADPAAPVERWARPETGVLEALALGPDAGYGAATRHLVRFDLATGEPTGSVELPSIQDLAVVGPWIYARTPSSLEVVQADDVGLRRVRTVAAPGSMGVGRRRLRLAAAGDLLYTTHTLGFGVFDLREPDFPALRIDHTTTQAGWRHLVPDGNGFGLAAVGPNSTDEGRHDVSLYNLRPGGTNSQFLATFPVPGSAVAVAVAGGRGYAADETAGLLVINTLPPDLGTNPPVTRLRVNGSEPSRPVEGGTAVRVEAHVDDDVGVRDVEFFLGDTPLARVDRFPYEVILRAPPAASGPPGSTFRVRARATDTAGNTGAMVTWEGPVVLDATPPRVLAVEPPAGATILPGLITEVRVQLDEPPGSPPTPGVVSVQFSGPDQVLGSPDDEVLPGTVRFDAEHGDLVWTAPQPLAIGRYRATLSAGLADAAGNARPAAATWEFLTGASPFVSTIFPFGPIVRVGGTVETITAAFNQPLPRVFSSTYRWRLSRLDPAPAGEIGPLAVQLAADARTFTLRPPTPLPAGIYQVEGSGPNLAPAQWTFELRTVPNEFLGLSGGVPRWKYPPGPLSNDVLVVNLPGTVAPISALPLQSVHASSDVRLSGSFSVREPVDFGAGLTIGQSVILEPGLGRVHGPLVLGPNELIRFRGHTLNTLGGGVLAGAVEFLDADGWWLNQPGSTLVLSNGFRVTGNSTATNPVGNLVNLGILRREGGTNTLRFEGARLRNDGALQVTEGGLLVHYLESDGTIDVSPAARLVLTRRARGGSTSRLAGDGTVEVGEWDALRNRLLAPGDVEWRGEVALTGPLQVHGGKATLWKPVQHPGRLELRETATLRLVAPARLNQVVVGGGNLELNADSEIGLLETVAPGKVDSAGRTRITGEALLRQGSFSGRGSTEFAGTTLVSNGTQQAFIRLLGGRVVNTGTWRMAFGSASGGGFDGAATGPLAGGLFENAGSFESTSAHPLVVRAPILNRGRIRLGAGTVTLDGRNNAAGAYRPQTGAELTLEGTRLDIGTAGVLDLADGTVSGIGLIQGSDSARPPKLLNRAVLRVGNPTGVLSVSLSAGVELTSTSVLIMTLDRSASSRLESRSGLPAFRLGGTLRLELAPGFQPETGAVFDILTIPAAGGGDIQGNFDRLEIPELPPGRKLQIDIQPRKVVAQVVAG